MKKAKDERRALRNRVGVPGWIRPDGGFAVRPCHVLDLSDTGIRIAIDSAHTVRGIFTFLKSRDDRFGRPARVKWRRGSQIGAEFV
jgi:hypothetical protein